MDFTARLTNTMYNRVLALVVAWGALAVVGVAGVLPAHAG
jgi:hypothetical protein